MTDLNSKVEGEFDEPKRAKRAAKVALPKSGDPWTVDVRKVEDFSEKHLDKLVDKLSSENKYLYQIYCSDVQAEEIEKFGKYKDVILTVEP